MAELLELRSDEDESYATERLIAAIEFEAKTSDDPLPELISQKSKEAAKGGSGEKKFKCKCAVRTIDEQREAAIRRRRGEQPIGSVDGDYYEDRQTGGAPNKRLRLGQRRKLWLLVGRLTRKSLIKELGVCRRLNGSPAAGVAILYKLEQLIDESECELSRKLAQFTRQDANGPADREPEVPSLIRAPVSDYDGIRRINFHIARDKTTTRNDSGDSGLGLENGNNEDDDDDLSPLDAHLQFAANERVQLLVCESIDFFEQLLESSLLFGRELSDLFAAADDNNDDDHDHDEQRLFSLQELKLYTCVECQKLRSAIRFRWLTKCLELALDSDSTGVPAAAAAASLKGKSVKQQPTTTTTKAVDHLGGTDYYRRHHLPPLSSGAKLTSNGLILEEASRPTKSPLDNGGREETRYFRRLAQLMGLLLRQHFLVPALAKWCAMFEANCRRASGRGLGGPQGGSGGDKWSSHRRTGGQLAICVDLLVGQDNGEGEKEADADNGSGAPFSLLAASRPNEQLKSSVGFMVDELAGICTNLPRIETQLAATNGGALPAHRATENDDAAPDSRLLANDGRRWSNEDFGGNGIPFLSAGDDLLATTKGRLWKLIDESRAADAAAVAASLLAIDRRPAEGRLFSHQNEQANEEASGGGLGEARESAISSLRNHGAARDSHHGPVATNEQRAGGRRLGVNIDSQHDDINGELAAEVAAKKGNNWIDLRYLLAARVVNKFRLGEGPTRLDSQLVAGFELLTSPFPVNDVSEVDTQIANISTQNDERVARLRQSCAQIRLLDQVDELLSCHLKRYSDFGFVLLDYEPFRLDLIKQLQQERRLIIRLNLDDLIKLMEKLRLHFDEIELGVDLETAIEDYLAEKWQARQLQAPSGANRLLLAGGDIDDVDALDDADERDGLDELEAEVDEIAGEAGPVLGSEGAVGVGEQNEIRDDLEEENSEKLLDVLLGSGNQNSQMNDLQQQKQLMSLVGGTTSGKSKRKSLDSQRQFPVAPLVECRLLVEKFEFFSDLLENGLDSLGSDVDVVFEGLIFLSEFVSSEQLEPSQAEMITELALRSREFNLMLSESLDRLINARGKLVEANELRSRVLSKLVLEFHQLSHTVSKKLLILDETTSQLSERKKIDQKSMSGSTMQAVRQLDSIQETSAWSQKLETRCEFLARINSLLLEEIDLLERANLRNLYKTNPNNQREKYDDKLRDHELREKIIQIWRPLTAALANLWRLVEAYETQLVKWLNSDTKRLDFGQIKSKFEEFNAKLCELREIATLNSESSRRQQEVATSEAREILALNIAELEARFEYFSRKRLPVFRFLANEHLTVSHWTQVAELASLTSGNGGGGGGGLSAAATNPQSCTTVAQLLELNVDQFIDKLELISRQATIEHELTMFLLAEVAKSQAERKRQLRAATGHSVNWLANWSDPELEVAAERFIGIKLEEDRSGGAHKLTSGLSTADLDSASIDCARLGRKLVALHSLVRRYLRLSYELGLAGHLSGPVNRVTMNSVAVGAKADNLVLRSCRWLTSSHQVESSIFVEFLKLFTESLLRRRRNLADQMEKVERSHVSISEHIEEMESLVSKVHELEQNELQLASHSIEFMLSKLERETINLELERESLATKEALALERQREALKIRDDCIRQITERAIPAIRAATRALDCLDEKCLRTLRSLRPNPPAAVRLVLEAVCLLRSCKSNGSVQSQAGKPTKSMYPLSPMRTFDAVRGQVIEDYWPIANKMINGTHSVKFIADLKSLDKKCIPNELMRLIRRRYLSSRLFNLEAIEKVSRESALLAKWLIAVDVFDRVINVVKPNYSKYMESERNLIGLFAEVTSRRRQIELVGAELQRLEDSFAVKVANRASLAELLHECRLKLTQIESTRTELWQKRQLAEERLKFYREKQRKLANKCLLNAASLTYLDAMRSEDRQQLRPLINTVIISPN